MLHQSNVYFERCSAADFDPERSFDERRRCWEAWLEHYGSGQSPLRVEHARNRVAQCREGIAVEPLPDVALSAVAPVLVASVEQDAGADAAPDAAPDAAADTGQPTAAQDADAASEPADDAAPDDAGTDAATDLDAASEDTNESTSDTRPRVRPRRQRPIQTGHAPEPCDAVCLPRWDACVHRCGDSNHSCVDACRGEYRICMGGCG